MVRKPAYAIVSLFLVLLLVGAGSAIKHYTTLLKQYEDLVQRLHFDEPFTVQFSAIGQRSVQLNLSLHTDIVREVYVDWGDPAQPSPVGGTRVYPTGTANEMQGGKLLLPPIVHTYGPVPSEGLRTEIQVRIVPNDLPTVPPETLSASRLHPVRRLLVLPYGVILDPPEAVLTFLEPKSNTIISPTTEVRLQVEELTAPVHLLAYDLKRPELYQYLGQINPPSLGSPMQTLTIPIDTRQIGWQGPFRLVALSTQLEATRDQPVPWHTVPQSAPRTAVDVRHPGRIIVPTPGSILKSTEVVRIQSFLPDTYYAAAVIRPVQGSDNRYYVQNDAVRMMPYAETPLEVFLGGGPNTSYVLYVDMTQESTMFKAGAILSNRPQVDQDGHQVYWLGPIELTKK